MKGKNNKKRIASKSLGVVYQVRKAPRPSKPSTYHLSLMPISSKQAAISAIVALRSGMASRRQVVSLLNASTVSIFAWNPTQICAI